MRIPARLMPAYHAEPWVVRGKSRKEMKSLPATTASKPSRISKNTLRLERISPITPLTKATAADWPPLNETDIRRTVQKRTTTTAVNHSLRSKARKRNRTNRDKKEAKSERIKLADTLAIIVREPKNCHSGPDIGCVGRSPSQEGTNHSSLARAITKAPQRQPARTLHPTSGSRNPPASKRLHETSVTGQRRRTYGSMAMYRTQKKPATESPQTKNSRKSPNSTILGT